VALAAAVVVVLAVATTAVVWYVGRGSAKVEFQTFADVGQPIAAGADRPLYVWTRLVGDRAYLAYQREDNRLEVIAVDAGSGKELWREPSEKTSEAWESLRAVPGAVVVLADATGSNQPREITVLDPGSGRRLWGRNVYGDDGTLLFDDRLVLVDRANDKLVGLDLRTGDVKWEKATPKDAYDSAQTSVYPVTTPEDLDGPAYDDGTLIAPGRDDRRLVQISSDRSARVIDVGNGEILKSRPNVAAPDESVLAHDGRLLVASSADGNLFAYDLETLGQPRTVYSAVDKDHRVEALAPCGSGRACLLEQASFDAKTNELISVDLDKGEERWREKAADFETLVPVGEHVMVLRDSPDYTTAVYDAGGGLVATREGVGVRVNGGSMLFFGKYLTTSVDDPSMAGLTVGSAQPVELGPLKSVRTDSCSWSRELIACAGDKDFRIYRFAKA
jgi:outer membrane protein assembly factor BamB